LMPANFTTFAHFSSFFGGEFSEVSGRARKRRAPRRRLGFRAVG
jgi:hypothetical protein